jgi:hypothetical protein
MACLVAVLCVGCGSSQNDAVQGAVTRFEAAVTAQDSGSACGLLAPATRSEVESSVGEPCVQAWPAAGVAPGGEVTRVRAYGSMAMVELDADTLFLARFPSGWRIMAAHCAPRAEKPYECQVKGS